MSKSSKRVSRIKPKSTPKVDAPQVDGLNYMIDDQNRAYYDSLEKDMEKEFQAQLAEIERREIEEIEEKTRIELEKKVELERILKEKEMQQNHPSKEELRQRRLKFYEK